jgi:hypothetical protein
MKGFLLHTAADTTNLGVVGPIFSDGSFEFIPIDNVYGIKTRSYKDFAARNNQYGRTLADFIPSYLSNRSVHFDPDFENYTYGQPVAEYPRSKVLEKIEEGDVVFFISSLAPYDSQIYKERDTSLQNFQRGKKNKYVIGFFTVKGVARVFVFKSKPRLTLALQNVLAQEEGEAPLDMIDLEKDLEVLREYGYLAKERGEYKLTKQDSESSRSGQDVADWIYYLWPEEIEEQQSFLENGIMDIELISGDVTEDIVKTSHHYKRLKDLDWDAFVLIVGDPKRSAIITHAIKLTEGFETFSFALNELGQSILGRKSDTLRGFRWIDEKSVGLLAKEIHKVNTELADKLKHLL